MKRTLIILTIVEIIAVIPIIFYFSYNTQPQVKDKFGQYIPEGQELFISGGNLSDFQILEVHYNEFDVLLKYHDGTMYITTLERQILEQLRINTKYVFFTIKEEFFNTIYIREDN